MLKMYSRGDGHGFIAEEGSEQATTLQRAGFCLESDVPTPEEAPAPEGEQTPENAEGAPDGSTDNGDADNAAAKANQRPGK